MKAVYAIKCIYTPLSKGVFLGLKDFDQTLLHGRWLESRDEYNYVLLYEVLLIFSV